MEQSQYRTRPIELHTFAPATGVVVNWAGDWLGEYNPETNSVDLYTDDDGTYIDAPTDWFTYVLEQV